MRLNQTVVMPSGRVARVINVTRRIVSLEYIDEKGSEVSFTRDSFDRLVADHKVVASHGVQTVTRDAKAPTATTA
jgi:hypothetical protein